MVARTADTQLRHSLLLLIVTLLGLVITYVVPPLALLAGLTGRTPWLAELRLAGLGLLGLAGMAVAFSPTLRLYRLGVAWSLTLPVAAVLFAAMTVASAVRYRRGTGGRWKGRVLTPEA